MKSLKIATCLGFFAALAAAPVLAANSPLRMRVPIGPIAPAAAPLTIDIPGYDPATGMFQAVAGAYTYLDGSYVTVATVNGHPAQVTLALAATAGSHLKAMLAANPAGVPGTQAAQWLVDNTGLQSVGGVWKKGCATGQTTFDAPFTFSRDLYSPDALVSDPLAACKLRWPQTVEARVSASFTSSAYWSIYVNGVGGYTARRDPLLDNRVWECKAPSYNYGPLFRVAYCYGTAPTTAGKCQCAGIAPASPEELGALPGDPLPVGAELPSAPYMPGGVPVTPTQITDLSNGTTYSCTNGYCGP